jgi:hypothetical protein
MSESPQSDAGSPGERSGAPSAGGGGAWQAWASGLVETVRALADGASVTLAAAPADARPVLLRKARLAGFIPARHDVVAPWVRLVRAEDHLRGHCVGAESIGGSFPFSPDEDAALLSLGWHHPGPGDGHDYVHFWPDDVPQGPFLPREEAERAAAMVAATFREVLGRTDATALPTVTPD